MKKFKIISALIFISVIIAFFGLVLPNYFAAKNNGKEIGSRIGTAVGTAVGSMEGIESGMVKGSKAGEEDGKSAKDTKVDYVTEISKLGRLEVLTTDIKAWNIHTYGDDSEENVPVNVCKYASLRVYEGMGVISVDLNHAEIEQENNTVIVNIPNLDVNIFVDDTKMKTVTEWESKFFNGKTESGIEAEKNTQKEIEEKLLEKLSETSSVSDQAYEAVNNQVTMLVKAMSKDEVIVQVNIVDSKIKPIEKSDVKGNEMYEESKESEE
ncbi:MAG: DUF4230 domain-containing protein [Eubacteriales bacterium]|nr:DUF4230 domain-containing protein [Eubacteriales bacterium]